MKLPAFWGLASGFVSLGLLGHVATGCFGAAPPFLWVAGCGSSYPDTNGTMSLRSALATDQGGNVYVTGGFRGDAVFGTNLLSSYGADAAADIFVGKYSPTGQLLWVRQAGSELDDSATGIAVDAQTNAYVTGYFQSTASFGGTNLTSAGNYDVFVAKYDSEGSLLWVRSAGGASRDQGQAVAVDGAGNVCVTGEFNLTATFGPHSLTNIWLDDIFVTKLDRDGNFLWAASGGGASQDFGFGIAADRAGNVYITGYLQYTGTFGTITVPPVFGPQFYDVFVAKYDPDGSPAWVRRAGSAGADGGKAVAVDVAGNVYVTGRLDGPALFESVSVPVGGLFLCKYSSSGDLDWVKVGEYGEGNAVVTDGQGNVYVAGEALLSTYIEGGYGGRDIFVAKYDSSGRRLWLQNAGSALEDSALGIALDGANNISLSGYFQGDESDPVAHFGGLTLTNTATGRYDNFITKLESAGVTLEARAIGEKIRLSWSTLLPGLTLQQSSSVLETNSWVAVPNGTNGVEVQIDGPVRFFRLVR